MSEDKTQNTEIDNDELTDDELENVTGGRRLSPVAVAAGDLMKTGARAARIAKPSAAGSAKQIVSGINMKNIQSAQPTGLKPGGGIAVGPLDDRE